MTYRPPCAVCGRAVEPDTDHVQIEQTVKRVDDRDEQAEFFFHERRASNTLGNWEAP